MEVGLDGIMMGNDQDWLKYQIGNFIYQGLIDEDRNPRPAYCAYQLLIRELKGATTIERFASPGNLHAYRFVREGQTPVYVAWAEGTATSIDVHSTASKLQVTRTPVSVADGKGTRQLLDVTDGSVSVPVDSTPVFVEDAR
jgi:methylmalonyl-CoA mutase N-terminal domain/subunit